MLDADGPILQWLHRCREGRATADDRALFDQIARVPYFAPPIKTADYLLAIAKLMKE